MVQWEEEEEEEEEALVRREVNVPKGASEGKMRGREGMGRG